MASGPRCSSPLGGGRVTLNEMLGIARASLGPDELVFADDAFVAVALALDPVLKDAGFFGQQANDLEAAAAGSLLVPVRRKAYSLSDRELMCFHRVLRGRRCRVGDD